VDQVKHNTNAVMALATGRGDEFLAEANFASPRPQASPCPLAVLAEARAMVLPNDLELQRVEVISAREQAQLARIEARRARIEAKLARVHIPAMAFNPVVVQAPKVVCPRVRVHMPRIPTVKMPALPVVHVQNAGFGSV
jgi:hypothetical protein